MLNPLMKVHAKPNVVPGGRGGRGRCGGMVETPVAFSLGYFETFLP